MRPLHGLIHGDRRFKQYLLSLIKDYHLMSLEKKDVEKVARLARLKITDEEATRYGTQLSNIINFVEQLKEVDTDNVEPLASVVDIKLRLREDVVTDGGIQADVIANAPESLEGFFVVPKVVE